LDAHNNFTAIMDYWWALVLTCIVNYCLTAVSLIVSVRTASQRQALAYSGDASAARRIILPCYRPLFQGLIVFFFVMAGTLCLTFADTSLGSKYFHILQYYNFGSMALFVITPVLLIQSSVSVIAFWNAAYTVIPWWLTCTIVWALSYVKGPSAYPLSILFVFIAVVPPIVLATLILTKLMKSRVQLGSISNRNSIEFLLVYAVIFGALYGAAVISVGTHNMEFTVSAAITAVSFVCNQIFPFALYRTLLADTKFWRGLGRHNQMGINVHDDLRDSGANVFRPTMDLSVINSTFQDMVAGLGEISVDFAYLQLERIIGHGATSEVYCGRYKKKLVAIKLSNPPEVTQEAIDVFVAEAKIASSLNHPNIVKFVGICVRPPQIAMVFEFCEGGNLKSNLQKNASKWTPIRRLHACLDACRAIESLHHAGLIHRDLKAENFFVGRKNVVKLGDFGESTHVRTVEATAQRRMTILGTVAFMAPELIAAKRHYTEAIDIYALAITMWEIWTGRDPYDDISQFDIYAKVADGYRPPLPTDSPPGFNDALQAAWQADAAQRPAAARLLTMMEAVRDKYAGGSAESSEEGEEGTEPASEDKSAQRGSAGDGDGDDAEGEVVAQINPILAANAAKQSRPVSAVSAGSDVELTTVRNTASTGSLNSQS
jgi:tRNA A-37 threonylcarbamoyl transferase component Bud32